VSSECVFCAFLAGRESEWNRLDDVVLRTGDVTAFVSPRWWPGIEGNVVVVPNAHVADLESADDATVAAVFAAARDVAVAMRRAYGCEGTSTREHNGAAAGQEIPHLHVHVFPRHACDGLYRNDLAHRFVPAEERRPYAERLRAALSRSD
jgi:histidine triad (HIT) family protein